MHEYSIVQALFSRIDVEARAHGATAVHRVLVRIGDAAGVELDLLATAFETFRPATPWPHTQLEVESVPVRWSCPGCGTVFTAGAVLSCGDCGLPARLDQGDEIVLERVEMEVP